ncbi:E3 ubiquitin-protein ligase SINA-like 7 [Triticum urartu]|uniref:E3 ubiquitin-protein ligase SINA-like 7 n=1 Tax=Triticum urartu TaxID=4572 RepID=UPI00204305CA|nr:E3 ubiquitin-protein ligase SINA-like 7 [Triticum urartu]
MDGSNTNASNRKVEAKREGESSTKKLKVTMGVETLDCPICYEPLRPPIFQLDKKCPVCSIKTSFKRCFGMEHVVQEAKVACSNDKYGCAEVVTYYKKEEHKKACRYVPCFCPQSGCGFAGSTKVLLDHFITQHKCSSTTLPDSRTVSLRLQPGLHVLRCTGYFFLLSMASEPFGHAISVLCVQPPIVMEPKFKCNMEYDCLTTSSCESTNCLIRSSSLSDGLPAVYDLIIPKGKISDDGNGIMLRATILSRSCLQGKGLMTADLQGTPCTKNSIAAAVATSTAAAVTTTIAASVAPAIAAAAVATSPAASVAPATAAPVAPANVAAADTIYMSSLKISDFLENAGLVLLDGILLVHF